MQFECGCGLYGNEMLICPKHRESYLSNSIMVDVPNKLILGTGPTIIESYKPKDEYWIAGLPHGPDRSVRLAHDKDCHCERCDKTAKSY